MIGTVPVHVVADQRYARLVSDRFGAPTAGGTDSPEFRLEVSASAPPQPTRDADHGQHIRTWVDTDRYQIAIRSAGAVIEPELIWIGGPLESDDDELALDYLLQSALAIRISNPHRLLVHAAAVAHNNEGLLIVGPSGSGKSTAAAAGLLGGWKLLADDLVVVDLKQPTITGVHRPPMMMASLIGGTALDAGTELVSDDPRKRLQLPASILDEGSFPLRAVVVVDHGEAAGSLQRLSSGSLDIMLGALAVDPVPAFLRDLLPGLARLAALPLFRLSHASEESERLERALELLAQAHR